MAEEIDIGGNRSKEVAEIINNKTCGRIIGYLKENESSEGDIAKALNLPASTVNYNIQKLLKNGFIKIKDFYWSEKGNRVNIYIASNKEFIFTSRDTGFFENKLKVVLPLISLAILVSFAILALFIVDMIPKENLFSDANDFIEDKLSSNQILSQEVAISKFSSCDNLISAFEKTEEIIINIGEIVTTASDDGTEAYSIVNETKEISLWEGEETTMIMDGVDHTIQLEGTNSVTTGVIIFDGIRMSVTEGQTYEFNGIKVYIGDIFYQSKTGVSSSAKFSVTYSSIQKGGGYTSETAASTASISSTSMSGEPSAEVQYSETNIQIEGVDEADIVKTDGKYIYTLSKGRLIIAKAYPTDNAKILSKTDIKEFNPTEMFVESNKLVVFGSSSAEKRITQVAGEEYYAPQQITLTTVMLYNIKDKENPELLRTLNFEGNYVSSRKIGLQVYFVVRTKPDTQLLKRKIGEDILPVYIDTTPKQIETGEKENYKALCGCGDVGYFQPINPENFIIGVSMSMEDANAPVEKKVVVGSGEKIYASLNNLYVAEPNKENMNIHKFALNHDNMIYLGHIEVPGRILNQFSMDEYNNYFRIATTTFSGKSENNVYVYDKNLNLTGKIENLAEGEKMHSARFMGDRVYLVTFRRVDPLFVIDLSNPKNPNVLGELKISGYSDYLHPYDSNHIIGIGKEVEEDVEQGLKMALFDVSNVSNPLQEDKVVIGDRWTYSYALDDHKAFLFDREKELLVIPVFLYDNSKGFTFQGAYVYRLTLDNGFEIRDRITHYDENETFKNRWYDTEGDSDIKRSLYINEVLYTISQNKIQMHSLEDLAKIKGLIIDGGTEPSEEGIITVKVINGVTKQRIKSAAVELMNNVECTEGIECSPKIIMTKETDSEGTAMFKREDIMREGHYPDIIKVSAFGLNIGYKYPDESDYQQPITFELIHGEPGLITENYDSQDITNVLYSKDKYIVMNALFQTPTPCYDVTVSVDYLNDNIKLLFDVHSTLTAGQSCIQVISEKGIKIKYGPLQEGTYNVTAIATYSNSGISSIISGPGLMTIA